VAGSIERSQALLRDLKEMPPALKQRAQARPRRVDLFGSAMRQSAPRPTPLKRWIAGDFQARFILLGAALLAVVVIMVLT
jgi:hypothetical protein